MYILEPTAQNLGRVFNSRCKPATKWCMQTRPKQFFLIFSRWLPRSPNTLAREYYRGKYHCTIDLLFDWFGLVCFAYINKNCQLTYSWFQTNQTGGQWYNDTSPFSIPCCSYFVRRVIDEEERSRIRCPPCRCSSRRWSCSPAGPATCLSPIRAIVAEKKEFHIKEK